MSIRRLLRASFRLLIPYLLASSRLLNIPGNFRPGTQLESVGNAETEAARPPYVCSSDTFGRNPTMKPSLRMLMLALLPALACQCLAQDKTPSFKSTWKTELPAETRRIGVADISGDQKPRLLVL